MFGSKDKKYLWIFYKPPSHFSEAIEDEEIRKLYECEISRGYYRDYELNKDEGFQIESVLPPGVKDDLRQIREWANKLKD